MNVISAICYDDDDSAYKLQYFNGNLQLIIHNPSDKASHAQQLCICTRNCSDCLNINFSCLPAPMHAYMTADSAIQARFRHLHAINNCIHVHNKCM